MCPYVYLRDSQRLYVQTRTLISSPLRIPLVKTLISAAALLLALTACGSDDDSNDSANESPSPTASATSDLATTTTSDAPEPPEETETASSGLVETEYGYTCESVFVEGAPVPAEAEDGCYDEAEDSVTVSFTEDCADGSLLILNPKGYGIVGKETHLPAAGEDEPDVNSAEYKAVGEECDPS